MQVMAETEKIYYSLRETETETGVPASTLRYWEKQFDELHPRKDGHGNRYYTRADQELIKRIRYIRDELKITRIEAIRKELKGNNKKSDERQSALEILLRVREELCEIRKMIK
jgi:DNA-binding transcriptional MerR regulator